MFCFLTGSSSKKDDSVSSLLVFILIIETYYIIPLKLNTRDASSYLRLFQSTWNCLLNCYSSVCIYINESLEQYVAEIRPTDHDGPLQMMNMLTEIKRRKNSKTNLTDYVVWHEQSLSILSSFISIRTVLDKCLELTKLNDKRERRRRKKTRTTTFRDHLHMLLDGRSLVDHRLCTSIKFFQSN